jgi:hypothetical protein
MPIEIKRQLMQKLKPEVIQVSDFLGVDLVKKWGYDRV